MLSLMEQTAHLRREWVRKEGPSIKQLIEKFPCLADPRIVRFYVFAHLFISGFLYYTDADEFYLITGATQTHFEQKYETLLFKFCRVR